jgi:hypothetical protein
MRPHVFLFRYDRRTYVMVDDGRTMTAYELTWG